MKKPHLLLLATLFLGACSTDEIATEQSEGKNMAPQLIATMGQKDVAVRSGVIEDNNEYTTLGEKFYWSNGDATTVFFRNPSMADETQYKKAEYAASVANGVQSANCTFNATQSESIDNGEYTAYGFYPTSAWDLRADFMSFLNAVLPAHQTQSEANSTHLGAYMLMKAKKDVTVNGSNPISLTYEHLAAVVRFAVWNNSGNSNLKLANINIRLNSGKAVFPTHGKLNDIDAASLTISNNSKVPALNLSLTGDARNFSTKDGKSQCEGYMALLPTAIDAFEAADNLIFELSFTDGPTNYLVTKTYNIGSSLGFLSGGIVQGKSYYFQLKVDSGDLTQMSGTSYAVGDYWPNSTSPEGIVFWVKPDSFGTQGKIVGLNETYVTKWGPDIDEEAAGVTGIRSLTDGETATKSLISKYMNSGTFLTDYPAFYYIYNTVNSGDENGAWYLPARDELQMLFAGYSGKVYESIVGWTSDRMPGYNSADCIAARTGFNAKLTAKGGMAIGGSGNSISQWYLSSSEQLDGIGLSFNFELGSYSSDPKSYDGNIRWIKKF